MSITLTIKKIEKEEWFELNIFEKTTLEHLLDKGEKYISYDEDDDELKTKNSVVSVYYSDISQFLNFGDFQFMFVEPGEWLRIGDILEKMVIKPKGGNMAVCTN